MRRFRPAARLRLVVLTAVCGLLCPASPAFAAPEDDYNLAVGLYKKQRWDEAAASFRGFLKAAPEHPRAEPARLYLGLALVNTGDYAPARETLREFVRLYPNSKNLPDALYRIGETSYSLNEFAEAEKDLKGFLDRYPEHELAEWALPYLADAQLRLDKPQEAVANFRRALDKYPQGKLAEEAKFGLARSYEALKKPDEAAAAYLELAAGNGPRAAASQLRVATLLYDAEKYADASKEFLVFAERFPQSPLLPTARLNAGFALFRSGDYAKAVEQLEAAAKTPEQTATATHWIGMTRKALGESEAATEAFRTVVEKYGDSPAAEESLFQWADSSLRNKQYEEAVRLFEQLAARDPKGSHAAESVYFAGEASLMSGDVDKAAVFVDRFHKEYPRTAYRMHNRLLAGRIAEVRADRDGISKEDRDRLERQALDDYAAVLGESELPATQAKARFQIARLREKQGEPAEALKVLEPLLDEASRQGAGSPYLDAFIIAARAHLALKEPEAAADAAAMYLELAPDGDQADAAFAERAVAGLAAGRANEAKADWTALREKFPKSDLLAPTARDLAERAYDKQDWAAAAEFFAALAEVAMGGPEEAVGLSGLGWSLHKGAKFPEAAAAFGRLLERFGEAPLLAPEAAYMRGKAFQDGGDLPAAAEAYAAAFNRFAPKEPAATGAESEGPLRNAYLSGLQLARVLRLQIKVAEADAAYAALTEKFPKPRNLDELLEEWALLHYEAEDYPKSDAIFRRLIDEAPESPLAANARLSLAESAVFAGRFDEAKPDLEALEADEKASPATRQRALSLLVSLAAERSDWKSAAELARSFLDRYPEGRERPTVLYQLGEAQLQLGDFEKAAETLAAVAAMKDDPAVKSQPWLPRLPVLLAEAAFQRRDYDAAVRFVEEVTSAEPRSEVAYLADEVLGRVLKNQTKFDEARTAFQRVLDDPNGRRTATAARAQYEVAQTFFLQQRWEEARTAAFKVYTLYKFPEWQAPALYMAGLCDEALGEKGKAASTLGDVVKEFPQSEYAGLAREKLAKLGGAGG